MKNKIYKKYSIIRDMEYNLPKPVGSPEVKYSGNIIEVVHQKMQIGENTKIYEQAIRSPGVRVMIVNGNRMLITKEYRTEIDGWDFRLAGGKVFDSLKEYRTAIESGKDMLDHALDAAKKEVLEETGLVVDKIRYFATSGTGGPTVRWDLYYFIVDEFHESLDGQMLEEGENITFEWMSLDDVKRLCLDGSFKEDRTVANILKFIMQ